MTENKGILPLKLGNARIMDNNLKLIHIINLTDYEYNIEIIENNVKKLINEINHSKSLNTTIIIQKKFNLMINSTKIILEKKFDNLVNTFDLIKPNSLNVKSKFRVKRGLVDGLGTIIKAITGNMDNNDYHEINNYLEILKLNQLNITNQFNKQIYINEKMIERFNNITNYVNNQQTLIEQFNSLADQHNTVDYSILIIQYCNQLIYDIELLNTHLENILESINLAKLNVISKHILHPEEITYVMKVLEEQHINIVSKETIYQFLELKAYYNLTNLIFIVQIPTFNSENFALYHLNELPINNNLTLRIPKSYIIINENEYSFLEKPCTQIENLYYCSKSNIQKIKINDCIPNIINDNKAHCNFIEIDNLDKIDLIQPNYLLIITQNEVSIESNCNQNIKEKLLRGITLIHFENCVITINNIQYSSKELSYWDKIEIIFTEYHEINNTKIIENINLKKLHKFTLENLKSIELLQNSNKNHELYKLIIVIILILTILVYIIIKLTLCIVKQRTKINKKHEISVNLPEDKKTDIVSEKYILRAI